MAIRQSTDPNLSPRERAELDWEKQSAQLQIDYAVKQKELEIELKRLEVKWSQLLRIPLTIVLLPVRILASIAIIAAAITKYELPKEFWGFIRG